MINLGVCYFLKRDKCFRPIFVMKVKDFPKFGKESAPIVGMFAFILNFILTRALIPGRIENLVALIDL